MLHYANIKSVQTSLKRGLACFNEILLKTLFTILVFLTAISRHKALIFCPLPVGIIRKTFDARREKTKKKNTVHIDAGYTGRYVVCSDQVKKASLRLWECVKLRIRKIREDTPSLIHLNLDSVNCTHVHVCCSLWVIMHWPPCNSANVSAVTIHLHPLEPLYLLLFAVSYVSEGFLRSFDWWNSVWWAILVHWYPSSRGFFSLWLLRNNYPGTREFQKAAVLSLKKEMKLLKSGYENRQPYLTPWSFTSLVNMSPVDT